MATTPVFEMKPPWTPELLPVVQKEIEDFIEERAKSCHPHVIDLGMGYSTVWFSLQKCLTMSAEHDKDWHEETVRAVLKAGGAVGHVLIPPEKFPLYVSDFADEKTDLVLVDCIDEQRLPCLFASLTKLKPDGWLVVDDSHWDMFDGLDKIMREMGFENRSFSGPHIRKTGEVKRHCTTIYSRSFK